MHYLAKDTSKRKPIRVLHHLGGLDRGGIETWLMHVSKRADKRSIQMDFLLRDKHQGDYQKELAERGSVIENGVPHRNPFEFAKRVRGFIAAHGPYDAVHSHIGQYDGIMLWVAASCGIPVRISHSHNDTRRLTRNGNLGWRLFEKSCKYLIKRYATHCVGASAEAADSLFGMQWRQNDRASILHCGIDLSSFEQSRRAPGDLRLELGIDENAFVVGHVGRFEKQKNHDFLFSIANELLRQDCSAKVIMVGRGPLKDGIVAKVANAQLSDRILVLDPRPDIPRLMLEVMDVFVLPSLHEGLPLVLLEAQAAGLPCFASDTVSRESSASEGAVRFLPLSMSAADWAATILNGRDGRRSRVRTPASLRGSSFDIDASVESLFSIYKAAA